MISLPYRRVAHLNIHTALLKFFPVPLLPIPSHSEALTHLNKLLELQGQQSRAARSRLAHFKDISLFRIATPSAGREGLVETFISFTAGDSFSLGSAKAQAAD